MKKTTILFFITLFCLSISCRKDDIISVTSIEIKAPFNTIRVGQQSILNIFVYPNEASNKSVTWTSSNTKIAAIDSGIIIGLAIGNVTIYAEANDGSGISASYYITVKEAITPEWIASKWLVLNDVDFNSLIGFRSLEFNRFGNFILIEQFVNSTDGPEAHFGYYQISGGNKIELLDIGSIEVYDYINNSTNFHYTPNNFGNAISYTVSRANEIEETNRTQLLCRSWRIISNSSECSPFPLSDEEYIWFFSRANTFCGSYSIWTSKWNWTDENEICLSDQFTVNPSCDDPKIQIIELNETYLKVLQGDESCGLISEFEAVDFTKQ